MTNVAWYQGYQLHMDHQNKPKFNREHADTLRSVGGAFRLVHTQGQARSVHPRGIGEQ